jgi:FixJ family two-component response regulator
VSREPLVAVIDDDDSFRAALADSLCSLGYGAREFASAEEFIAGDGEGSCDCVVTDIHMPGIMITARAEPGLEAKAASSGAVCLLRKPFESSALIGCLERALKV